MIFIESIANALQYISYYHSEDFILAMKSALEVERSDAAKDAILQILQIQNLQRMETVQYVKIPVLLQSLLSRGWILDGILIKQSRRW